MDIYEVPTTPSEGGFEAAEIQSQAYDLQKPDICESEPRQIEICYEPKSFPDRDTDSRLGSNEPPSQQTSLFQFALQLLRIGGPPVAMLLAFQMIVRPLLIAGSSPVALVLAIAVSVFLILYGIVPLIREWLNFVYRSSNTRNGTFAIIVLCAMFLAGVMFLTVVLLLLSV
jgi:hypothetical protein